MSRKKKENVNYVDNAEFLRAIIEYRKQCKAAKSAGNPKPRMPDYLGDCIMKIAENRSHEPCFARYTYRDEMVADAIENCLLYFDNYNPKKTSNPFAYFSQITFYAFVRKIKKEKKQLYKKYKLAEQMCVLGEMENSEDDDRGQQVELYDNIKEFIGTYEEAKLAKSLKKKTKEAEEKSKKKKVNG